MKPKRVTIQTKAIEQYFHVLLFIMLYKVVLTLKCVDETQACDHSNESCWAVLSCVAVYYAVQGGSNFSSVDSTIVCVTIRMEAIEHYFHVVLFIVLYKVVLTVKSVDETQACDHSNESYSAVLSCV